MLLTAVRRAGAGVIGAGVIATVSLWGAAPSALANQDPALNPPNCTAADLAQVAAGVSAGTSVYLFTHPDVNNFFTSLEGLSREEARKQVKAYMAANPGVAAELGGVRQPLVDIKNRCGAAPVAP